MYDHDCSEAGPLVSAYLDGEVTESEQKQAEQILAACPVCAGRAARLSEVSAVVKRQSSRPEPTSDLWGKLMRGLDTVDQSARSPARPMRRLQWAGALVIVAAVAWAVVGRPVTPLSVSALVANDGSHPVAMLRTNDLQKAVQWAEGRVGHKLKPVSLVMSGYTLVSVAEINVDRAKAAAFHYQSKDQSLDIYQIPSGGRPLSGPIMACPGGPAKVVLKGQEASAAAWQHLDMTFAVVSALSPTELDRIANEVAAVCR